MTQPIDEITITEDNPANGCQIEAELLRVLRQDLPQGENTSFMLAARDQQDCLVAGLVGSTSYGWLLIKLLWVAKAYQRRSLGRSLLERAEERAKMIGCHGAWLDTSNPDAMLFYGKLGYSTFGELANELGQQPARHRRWFMKKALS